MTPLEVERGGGQLGDNNGGMRELRNISMNSLYQNLVKREK